MRVLVIGATGYIGSRTVPALVAAGHEVTAGAREPTTLDRFAWGDRVDRVELDVLDAASVDAALARGVDALVYLVHGMGGTDFRRTDRTAATTVREAVDAHRVPRIVYVSGIIPPIDEGELSEHLTSRLEVERLLSSASATVITLRAAMVLGAGSTSFELMAQLAQRLPVTIVPDWMDHEVEPIAVVDLVAVVAGALEARSGTDHFDIGGGERMPYPELIERYTRAAGTPRSQIDVPLLPQGLVATVASWLADVPSPTVTGLMESLREDMVASERRWIGELVADTYRTVSVEDAFARSLGPSVGPAAAASADPMRLQPGDHEWATAVGEVPELGGVRDASGARNPWGSD
ncbi:NAD(P)H-binding protein [Pseudoclavibacter chungangensis]|uniref:NAD(P)H-binding protein n=1 Tax=Pseudoclavibacter chungangensis TaxID=587635 RepID=A0A7J5BQG1_9MICO|nr:NAD(P)H-binding protein [Pseudoclavibacter chungangensis]KAB1656019.1 NAD(P)H-binding protein [Pseudoclavibacter chungangensis]NYJ66475.1 uncharacterized protein YbjT (DUF2867 family) [Pseudoclavibacter chungangensis]